MEEFVSRPVAGRSAPSLTPLTEREREVLSSLVGACRTARSPGGSSYPATTMTHVSRILTKLRLRDRVQAVVLAYEAGLVRAGDGLGSVLEPVPRQEVSLATA